MKLLSLRSMGRRNQVVWGAEPESAVGAARLKHGSVSTAGRMPQGVPLKATPLMTTRSSGEKAAVAISADSHPSEVSTRR